eukprot:gb/GECG01009412.1/.p1 GENE.gb/GECG01009412.1/~~gb/GECG01009412.1/.p1  ORF type:complete len:436 (+),score=85.18 gb/GECG01009412.1/:1-1308(+)
MPRGRSTNRKRRERSREKRVDKELLEPNTEKLAQDDSLTKSRNEELFAVDTKGRRDSQPRYKSSGGEGSDPLEPAEETNLHEVLDELSDSSDEDKTVQTSNKHSEENVPAGGSTSNVKVFKRDPSPPRSKKEEKEKRKFLAKTQKRQYRIAHEHSTKKTESDTSLRPNAPVNDFHLQDLWGSNIQSKQQTTKKKGGKSYREGSARPDIPAVAVAHPGASYNPSYEDHEDAMGEAVAEELEKEDTIERNMKRQRRDPEFINRLDTSDHEEGGEEDTPDDTSMNLSANPSTSCNRLTRVQVNRRMRHEEKEAAIQQEKEERKLHEQIDRVEEIAKSLDREENRKKRQKEARKLQRGAEEKHKALKSKRGGKEMPYEQNRLQVPLPEELTNSMRSMPSTPATTNLVNERFRNMVYHRGLVERGKKQPRQRAWRKFVDK